MFTITAFAWVPDFAKGQVRDLRVRWMLEEVGLPYRVRLIDRDIQNSPAYRAEQPFGQVPTLSQEGRPTLFETGAILLELAERTGKLLPRERDDLVLAKSWLFASLNSVEPCIMNLADVDFFTKDKELRAKRRPTVVSSVELRLKQLQAALGTRDYLVGHDFTIADLMMATVLRSLDHTDILGMFPALSAYKARCTERPAFKAALAGQCGDFTARPPG